MEQRKQQVTRAAGRHDKLAVIRLPAETQRLAKATAAMRGETIGTFVARLVEQEATPPVLK
jgi:uncharacterized protein (DUF1778 family)